jgi:hypothetical protein
VFHHLLNVHVQLANKKGLKKNSVRDCINPGAIVRLEGLGTLSEFNDIIGTETRDLLACSIAYQTSTLPRDNS